MSEPVDIAGARSQLLQAREQACRLLESIDAALLDLGSELTPQAADAITQEPVRPSSSDQRPPRRFGVFWRADAAPRACRDCPEGASPHRTRWHLVWLLGGVRMHREVCSAQLEGALETTMRLANARATTSNGAPERDQQGDRT